MFRPLLVVLFSGLAAAHADLVWEKPVQEIHVVPEDKAVIAQFATMMATREVAGAMGKIVTIGSERALQSVDGDLHMTVGGKFIIAVQGSASVVDKLAYARAIDMAALSKL